MGGPREQGKGGGKQGWSTLGLVERTGGDWGTLGETGGDWRGLGGMSRVGSMLGDGSRTSGSGGGPQRVRAEAASPPSIPGAPAGTAGENKAENKKKKAAANPQPAPSALLRFTPCCRSPAGTTRRLFSPQNHPVSQLALPKSPSAAPKPPGFAPLRLARSPSGLVAAWGAGKGNGVGLHPKI